MNIIYFADIYALELPDLPSKHVFFYRDFKKFLDGQHPADCFILGKFENIEDAIRILSGIISDANYHLHPIFFLEALSPYTDVLADAISPTFDEMKKIILEIKDFAQILPPFQENTDKDTLLLRFLYIRPQKMLSPICCWLEKEIYQYPLLNILSDKEITNLDWCDSLLSRQLIEEKSLVDRIRNCPVCHLSHLNYIDACYNCHSINIEEVTFLHCFTCGYIGNQQEFLHEEKMSCPKCQARLRHIGTDYDRPLENYHCRDCHENFIEPIVLAKCFHCKTLNETESLITQNIYDYALTELAKINIRNNSISDIYAVLDHINYTIPKYFQYQLNWSIKMARRYPEIHFALIMIEIIGVTEMAALIGRAKTHALLQECATRIRGVIRDTDITTRTRENKLWILIPQTLPEGCKIIVDRLNEISKDTEQENKTQLIFKIVYIVSADFDKSVESAKTIMAKLSMELA
jgi:GGDEF domain-containing protein